MQSDVGVWGCVGAIVGYCNVIPNAGRLPTPQEPFFKTRTHWARVSAYSGNVPAMTFPTPPDHIFILAFCAFLAGLIRGFSGFGLSAVLVASAAFVIPPKLIIPTAQAMEVIASIALIPTVWRDVNWKWLTPMGAAYLISIPFGVAALAYLPEAAIRVGGCVLLLVATLCLLLNRRPNLPDGLPLRFGTGLVAGFFAGASSLGGMVASVMLFAVSIPAKQLRATLIVLFFGSALYSLSWGAWHGVVTEGTFVRAAWLAVPLLIGIAVGTHGFKNVSEKRFRQYVLVLLATLAVAGIVNVIFNAISSPTLL